MRDLTARFALGTREPERLNQYVSPACRFGAVNAWWAKGAATSGGNITSLAPLMGAVALTPGLGTTGAPTANALLGGRVSIPFVGLSSLRGTITAPGDSQTMLVVGTTTAVENGGFLALTNAGAPNTGSALIRESAGDVFVARRIAVSANSAAPATPPKAFIFLATFTTATCVSYVNSRTSTASAGASGSFSQAKVHLGEGADAIVNMSGSIAEAAIWNRVLTAAEIDEAVVSLALEYKISVAP